MASSTTAATWSRQTGYAHRLCRAWLPTPDTSPPAPRFAAWHACNTTGVLSHASAPPNRGLRTRHTVHHEGEGESVYPHRSPASAHQGDVDDGGGARRDHQALAGAPLLSRAGNGDGFAFVTHRLPCVSHGVGWSVHGHRVPRTL